MGNLKAKSNNGVGVENVELRLNELGTQLDKNVGSMKQSQVERLGEITMLSLR